MSFRDFIRPRDLVDWIFTVLLVVVLTASTIIVPIVIYRTVVVYPRERAKCEANVGYRYVYEYCVKVLEE